MQSRFELAVQAAITRQKAGIGTLGEKGVHHTLKHYYEPDTERHEVPLGNYYADIVGENGVIEIQSASFLPLVPKLTEYLALTHVTVIWPCIKKRRIIRIDRETGEVLDRRISPKKQTVYEIFPRLEQLGELAFSERLSIIIVTLEADEYRVPAKNRTRKERIKAKLDLIPTKLIEELHFECPNDLLALIPKSLSDEFTCSELAACLSIHKDIARSVLWYMRKCGAAIEKGRKGREKLYCKNLGSEI